MNECERGIQAMIEKDVRMRMNNIKYTTRKDGKPNSKVAQTRRVF